MPIDERIERLTERHEALAESVEMLRHDLREVADLQKQNARGIANLLEAVRELTASACGRSLTIAPYSTVTLFARFRG